MMAGSEMDKDTLRKRAREMASEGRTISYISAKLGISWPEARSYTPGWIGTKQKLTRRLNRLVLESDQSKREKLAAEADRYADFLYDAAKHLRKQVDDARKALNR